MTTTSEVDVRIEHGVRAPLDRVRAQDLIDVKNFPHPLELFRSSNQHGGNLLDIVSLAIHNAFPEPTHMVERVMIITSPLRKDRKSRWIQVHFDSQLNVTVCLWGQKTWRILPLSAIPRQSGNETVGVEWDADLPWQTTTLRAGDVLVLPAGWWHTVISSSDGTLCANYWLPSHAGAVLEGLASRNSPPDLLPLPLSEIRAEQPAEPTKGTKGKEAADPEAAETLIAVLRTKVASDSLRIQQMEEQIRTMNLQRWAPGRDSIPSLDETASRTGCSFKTAAAAGRRGPATPLSKTSSEAGLFR